MVLTGDGTLIVNGNCKNGIKVSDLDADDKNDGYTEASFIIDGENLTINVTAANDGINSGTDLTIKSGNITVSAGDDGIKADYILTIGEEGKAGPTINVKKSNEGIEGATVNIYSGTIDVTASDDGINAANGDLTGYTYSLNIMGGTINISAGRDGIDSNGNVNITGGLTTIVKSASNGGEGGLDYNGTCYIAEGCFVNPYGTTMDSGKGGFGGGQNGQMPGRPGQNGGSSDPRQGGQGSQRPGRPGENGDSSNPWQGGQWPRGSSDGQGGQWPWSGQDGESGTTPDGQSGATPPDLPQDGQMPVEPPQDGQQPTDPPQNGQMPSDDSKTSEDQELNWFQRLIKAIVEFFTTDLRK